MNWLFQLGRGCVNQIFVMRQSIEKTSEWNQKLYTVFLNLEKAFNKVDREGLREVLKMHGVNGKHFDAVKSFYSDSKPCQRLLD